MTENKPIVLVIEDHEEISALASYFLRRGNYQPVVAQNGIEGLRLARTISPALILCDACLPELNGAELIEILRAIPATAQIPFVMMSGYKFARWGNSMPAAFLPKPFRMEEMLAVVRAHTPLPQNTPAFTGGNGRQISLTA